jgi:hypothetical protein
MTLQRPNLAGITSAELLSKIEKGESFFVRTKSPNITRQMISYLKKSYKFEVETTQAEGGLWVKPKQQ